MKKIPDNATKVFEGSIFDVYHWEQELFDGSTSIFEAIKRTDSVTVIATVGDKIIITKEEQPGKGKFLGLPGGRVEAGESPIISAKRELAEETGYSTDDFTEWFIEDSSKMSKLEWNTYYYLAKNCKKTQEAKPDPGEKIEVQLLSFEEFLETKGKIECIDLIPILEKASRDEGEKQKLQELLFANN